MYGGLRRNLRLWSVVSNWSSDQLVKQDTLKQEQSGCIQSYTSSVAGESNAT